MSTRGAEWLAERRANLEALEVEQGPRGCVERPLQLSGIQPVDGGAAEPDVPPPGDASATDLPAVDETSAPGGP
jgi:hypothetical protein